MGYNFPKKLWFDILNNIEVSLTFPKTGEKTKYKYYFLRW